MLFFPPFVDPEPLLRIFADFSFDLICHDLGVGSQIGSQIPGLCQFKGWPNNEVQPAVSIPDTYGRYDRAFSSRRNQNRHLPGAQVGRDQDCAFALFQSLDQVIYPVDPCLAEDFLLG
jgi:hypothetical protein